jgi:hypothetical protein
MAGCALGFGGSGAEYIGSLRFRGPKGEIPLGNDEVVTVTGRHASQLGEKAAFVADKALLESNAKGFFLDRPHQTGISDVPIGVCGVEELGRPKRDSELLEEGCPFSEVAVAVMEVFNKADVDRVCAPTECVTRITRWRMNSLTSVACT